MPDSNKPEDINAALSGDYDANQKSSSSSWTNYLPEAYGIRKSVQESRYRWCFRESALWGIGTATAMTLHRMRMGSGLRFNTNVGFSTLFMVYTGSYYFCVKRRNQEEEYIAAIMNLNMYEPASAMPEQVPAEEDPFAQPSESGIPTRIFDAKMKPVKEWQPRPRPKEFDEVFKPAEK
jgi:hypothetical protein